MNPKLRAALSIALATFAVLGTQVLSYGLVYPARYASKWPLALALLAGSAIALGATGLSLQSLRGAATRAERFVALISLILSSFFLFVIIFGFGVPDLLLGATD
ncbi:MAG TPA: hypothetical protein VHV51_02710 [Polyangiaceae bacterium]|jgi:hypothetical protein|nr:hypothetical protein [Polyangiaceae bacterium]